MSDGAGVKPKRIAQTLVAVELARFVYHMLRTGERARKLVGGLLTTFIDFILYSVRILYARVGAVF